MSEDQFFSRLIYIKLDSAERKFEAYIKESSRVTIFIILNSEIPPIYFGLEEIHKERHENERAVDAIPNQVDFYLKIWMLKLESN
jgi:hypothetical protein